MHILLSNDDGYRAPGLRTLYEVLSRRWRISVAAPDRDRSGASNSLTLRNPLRADRREDDFIVIEGTPTDCVHLALTGLLEETPDLVVSGINAGGNLGDDVLYSGTVAAALEGRHLGLPAIAVSLVGEDPRHYETAAGVVERLLDNLHQGSIPPGTVLNVNVPDLPADRREDDFIVIEGTPTDCVHLALTGLLEETPDLVVSGINAGGNLGDDVLYSGTVAAALEGRHLGLPAIAVSLVGEDPRHYDTAAGVVERLLDNLHQGSIPPGTVLNVNVPDLPAERLRGARATRLGHRHRSRPAVAAQDPAGRRVYWFGEAGDARDRAPGTDFHTVEEGFVSVTPLHADLTRHRELDTIATWLRETALG